MNNGNAEHAFPVSNDADVNEMQGMTLRDYFAAKAMQGDFANGGRAAKGREKELADEYYRMADAMMEARKEGGW